MGLVLYLQEGMPETSLSESRVIGLRIGKAAHYKSDREVRKVTIDLTARLIPRSCAGAHFDANPSLFPPSPMVT